MTRIQETGERARLELFRAVIETKVKGKIKGEVPWTYFATPSTFRRVYNTEGEVYAIAFDTTRLDASRVISDQKLAHDIQTALKEKTGNVNLQFQWVNSDGACALIDERHKGFPDEVPLPKAPAGGYMIPLGVNRAGQQRWISLAEAGHILVGGQTRYGKSTGFYAWLQSLISQHGPDELEIAIVDGKRYEFLAFNGSVYLPGFMRGRVAVEVDEAQAATEAVWIEINRRKKLFEQHRVYSLKKLAEKAGIRLPVMLLVMDEYNTLVENGFDDTNFKKILQQGAGLGVYVIAGMQRPDADTLKKTNFGTTLSYRMSHSSEAQVFFGTHHPYHTLKACSPGELVVLGPGLDYEHLKGFFVDKEKMELVTVDVPEPAKPAQAKAEEGQPVQELAQAETESMDLDPDWIAYQVCLDRGRNHLKSKFGIGSRKAERLQAQAERFRRIMAALGYEIVRTGQLPKPKG